jgi:hypothetical protein
LCHFQQQLHCIVFTRLDKGWALVIIPNKVSRTGSEALLSLEKLINQLDKMVFGLTALAGVSVTAMEVRPVVLATLADSISRFIKIIEYYCTISWPTFFSMLVI